LVESKSGSIDIFLEPIVFPGTLQLALLNVEEQQTENLGNDYETNEVDNNLS
jgi:hypothetical protein